MYLLRVRLMWSWLSYDAVSTYKRFMYVHLVCVPTGLKALEVDLKGKPVTFLRLVWCH